MEMELKSNGFAHFHERWNIGKTIYEICGQNERAAYGKNVLEYISDRLTKEFGKGFDESNLRNMRRFYLTFSIRDTVCPELSWSHYRLLMRVANEKERMFYTQEAVKSGWSVRQLERQINTMFYQRILASRDAAKYMPYMPTEEELKRELNLDEFEKLEDE